MSLLRVLLPVLMFPGAVAANEGGGPLVDFRDAGAGPRWVAVNDGVMGGRSRGGPAIEDGVLVFSGVLSLENNGGFSSVRTVDRAFDLGAGRELVLRVRGDGRRYQLRLATDARWRGLTVSWAGDFDTVAGQWTEVRVPLATLRPTVRGLDLQGPPMDPSRVREIGLMIADKREGPFRLEVESIALR